MISNFASGPSRSHHRNQRPYQSQTGISTKQLFPTKQSQQQHARNHTHCYNHRQPTYSSSSNITSNMGDSHPEELEPDLPESQSSTDNTLLTIGRSLPESRDSHQSRDRNHIRDDDQKAQHHGRPSRPKSGPQISHQSQMTQKNRHGLRARNRSLLPQPISKYHEHIDHHPSPRTSKSANPYQLLLDQKRLHQTVKVTAYPYLSWHWFVDKWEVRIRLCHI